MASKAVAHASRVAGIGQTKTARAVIIIALVIGIGVYHYRDDGKARVMKVQNTEGPRGTLGLQSHFSNFRLSLLISISLPATHKLNVIPSISPYLGFFLRPEHIGLSSMAARGELSAIASLKGPTIFNIVGWGRQQLAVLHQVPNNPLPVSLPDFVSHLDCGWVQRRYSMGYFI